MSLDVTHETPPDAPLSARAEGSRPPRCLWISRDIPFPQDAGDRIYSANMARALADAGVSVSFLGYAGDALGHLPDTWSQVARNGAVKSSAQVDHETGVIDTYVLTGAKRGKLAALASTLPIAAAIHATLDFHAVLKKQLSEQWDLIVIDSYGSGWALDACLAAQARAVARGGVRPTLIYLSHNHEESIWRTMAAEGKGNPLKRLALWQNYLKVRALERRLARDVDLISAITDEDARIYARQQPGKPTVSLTPGYSGRAVAQRSITASTPRRVVLVGSFRWVVKQENLRRFLELADARFKAHDIRFDVIGDVPQALLDELRAKVQATQFHGFVDDIAPYFDGARLAVVPEVIGGGFKLKYLDYLFSRVPIATITEAAAGLPRAIRDNMICRDDLSQLVDAIVDAMDRTEQLDAMQAAAFDSAQALFDWKDRGRQLRDAAATAAALHAERRTQGRGAAGSTSFASKPKKVAGAMPAGWESRP